MSDDLNGLGRWGRGRGGRLGAHLPHDTPCGSLVACYIPTWQPALTITPVKSPLQQRKPLQELNALEAATCIRWVRSTRCRWWLCWPGSGGKGTRCGLRAGLGPWEAWMGRSDLQLPSLPEGRASPPFRTLLYIRECKILGSQKWTTKCCVIYENLKIPDRLILIIFPVTTQDFNIQMFWSYCFSQFSALEYWFKYRLVLMPEGRIPPVSLINKLKQ